ncbi:MAG: YhbY family RNA-binding protein [Thermoplasmata archaeon]
MEDEKAKKLGQDLSATVRVGKEGISEGMVKEINRQLEDNGLIKIKILRNSPYEDMSEVVDIIQGKVKGRTVEIRGKTILLVEK